MHNLSFHYPPLIPRCRLCGRVSCELVIQTGWIQAVWHPSNSSRLMVAPLFTSAGISFSSAKGYEQLNVAGDAEMIRLEFHLSHLTPYHVAQFLLMLCPSEPRSAVKLPKMMQDSRSAARYSSSAAQSAFCTTKAMDRWIQARSDLENQLAAFHQQSIVEGWLLHRASKSLKARKKLDKSPTGLLEVLFSPLVKFTPAQVDEHFVRLRVALRTFEVRHMVIRLADLSEINLVRLVTVITHDAPHINELTLLLPLPPLEIPHGVSPVEEQANQMEQDYREFIELDEKVRSAHTRLSRGSDEMRIEMRKNALNKLARPTSEDEKPESGSEHSDDDGGYELQQLRRQLVANNFALRAALAQLESLKTRSASLGIRAAKVSHLTGPGIDNVLSNIADPPVKSPEVLQALARSQEILKREIETAFTLDPSNVTELSVLPTPAPTPASSSASAIVAVVSGDSGSEEDLDFPPLPVARESKQQPPELLHLANTVRALRLEHGSRSNEER